MVAVVTVRVVADGGLDVVGLRGVVGGDDGSEDGGDDGGVHNLAVCWCWCVLWVDGVDGCVVATGTAPFIPVCLLSW